MTNTSTPDLRTALKLAEAALSDIGDADHEPGDDLAWCEARAAKDLPAIRAALAAPVQAREAPTDDELREMWRQHAPIIGGPLSFARAVLAKWGAQPAVPDAAIFEFWWADHMPNAPQADAWAEWCALRGAPHSITAAQGGEDAS